MDSRKHKNNENAINETVKSEVLMLHNATEWDNADLLKRLLTQYEPKHINAKDPLGRTLVYKAVVYQSVNCLKFLLENKADPSIPGGSKSGSLTPLHYAVAEGKKHMVEILLQHNTCVETTDGDGETPLQLAEVIGNVVIIEMLKMKKEERRVQINCYIEELRIACTNGSLDDVTMVLQRTASDLPLVINSTMDNFYPPLCIACRHDCCDIAELLVKMGANSTGHPLTLESPLHTACEYSSLRLVKLILKTFPGLITQCTIEDLTPLHMAAERGDEDIMTCLLDHTTRTPATNAFTVQPNPAFPKIYQYQANFDLNFLDGHCRTPLFHAVMRLKVGVVKLMLDYRIDVWKVDESAVILDTNRVTYSQRKTQNACDKTGEDKTVVCPFNVNLRDQNGVTPLLAAVAKSNHEIVEALLEAGADVSLPRLEMVGGFEAASPLMCAALNNDVTTVMLLLRHGARDKDNDVYNVASIRGFVGVVATLMRHRSRRDIANAINRGAMFADQFGDHCQGATPASQDERSRKPEVLYPTYPVMIDWSAIQSLQNVDETWVSGAVLTHNPSLSPSSAFYIYAVTRINLSSNSLQNLPGFLFQLPSLQLLDCTDNLLMEITDVATPICPALLKLTLKKNRLTTLPSFIFHLPLLASLDASFNHLTTVPPDVWTSASLKNLDLSQNKLIDIPPPKTILANHRPQLDTIQSVAGQESDGSSHQSDINTDVKHLNYWSKNLQVIETNPSDNDRGVGISMLNLSNNQLTALPEGISCLAPNLHTLNLSYNKLKNFGAPALYPGYLDDLDLSHNYELKWVSLLKLDPGQTLAEYRVCYRSKSVTSSSGASISSQTISRCVHRQHDRFPHLTNLNLSYCKQLGIKIPEGENEDSHDSITRRSLPSEIQAQLIFPVLQTLDLSYTSVSRLPPEIGEMSNLTSLQLAYTNITELPGEMGLLKKLCHLDLESCKLDGAVQGLVENKVTAADIVGFLDSVREEAVEYNCMNLMFVGAHQIGKTSLLQLMRKEGRSKHKYLHWAERVSDNFSLRKGDLLSTVGIDINELVIDRKEKGPVRFRTWDFGGQKEYYATHQYFLSPRSLYLVIWKLTSGESGIRGVVEWLINIQARAPRSHVIVVGTHLDVLRTRTNPPLYPPDFEASMMQRLREIIGVLEPDKFGLPNVLAVVNVSCKTEENVKMLIGYIYYQVFTLHHPKSKNTLILKQKIPKKYLTLQKIVEEIAVERKRSMKDPVLSKKLYSMVVMNKMIEQTNSVFRDTAELQQATNFLHENGVLFHFTDEHLKDLYFLDPQWLCDQLAQVVTIKDINCFAPNGVMEISNLQHLFKGFTHSPLGIMRYIVSLLERFEVALPFDEHNLIIPSMLPTEQDLPACISMKCDVRIPIRRHAKDKVTVEPFPKLNHISVGIGQPVNTGNSTFFSGTARTPTNQHMHLGYSIKSTGHRSVKVKNYCNNPMFSLTRLYLMTYFPSGFWPRLITRLLADSSFFEVTQRLYQPPRSYIDECAEFAEKLNSTPEWRCWRTGVELRFLGTPVLWVKEYNADFAAALCDYAECELMCVQEGDWAPVDLDASSIIELHIPSTSITFTLQQPGHPITACENEATKRTLTVHKDMKTCAGLLAKIVEHIDVLLHDWFPDLGELRLAQNMDGRYLITRLVPCPKCVIGQKVRLSGAKRDWWNIIERDVEDVYLSVSFNAARDRAEKSGTARRGNVRLKRSNSMTPGADLVYNRDNPEACSKHIYTFMVENCIVLSKAGKHIICPQHGAISPHFVADDRHILMLFHLVPEIIFQDLPESLVIPSNRLQIGSFLGRGSFGFVFAGELLAVENGVEVLKPVALKLLEPIETNFELQNQSNKPFSEVISCASSMPMEHATRGYLNARQEVSIHRNLHHENIVELIGLTLNPLCLVLNIAPFGELCGILLQYQYSQARLSVYTLKHIIQQASSGLAYLHSENIVYRDLKSDNILVWSFPPHTDPLSLDTVHVKISDYGISRAITTSGTRGFGGSPPFMAPEIIHHGGKDTYTTKVDCFSFGMFIYELVTCHQPFADYPSPGNLNLLVYQGGRPNVTAAVTEYPSYILDLMTRCWSQDARQRPSSEEIHMISSRPEFCHLMDAVSMETTSAIVSSGALRPVILPSDEQGEMGDFGSSEPVNQESQVWLSTHNSSHVSHLHIFTFSGNKCSDKMVLPVAYKVTSMCDVAGHMWCVNEAFTLSIYSSITLDKIYEVKVVGVDARSKVVAMLYAESVHRVVIVTDVGDTVVYRDDVMTETEPSLPVVHDRHGDISCASLMEMDDSVYELWSGHSDGSLCTRRLSDHSTVYTHTHDDSPSRVKAHCLLLVTQHIPHPAAWSYNYPGSIIYRWDGQKKTVTSQLDISTVNLDTTIIVPRSKGSLRVQVTAMNVLREYLYIGTTSGCVLVTTATTLVPITRLHCHSNEDYYVRDLIVLPTHDLRPCVVSVGKGYISLMNHSMPEPSETLQRYANFSETIQNLAATASTVDESHGHVLSWLADGWQHY